MKHFRFNVRCEDGRAMRHERLHDDPYFEMDIGCCEDCQGFGCDAPERDHPCFGCNGEGGFDDERCDMCGGSGVEWYVPQPMTIDDLADMCGDN